MHISTLNLHAMSKYFKAQDFLQQSRLKPVKKEKKLEWNSNQWRAVHTSHELLLPFTIERFLMDVSNSIKQTYFHESLK